MRQAAFHSPLISGLPIGGVTPMSTTARLEDLKRDLARLERKRTGSPRQGRTVAEGGRGREAEHPGQIPSRGWMDVLWRAWGEVGDANLFLIAGGVTYALILALFPGLAALVSLYGIGVRPLPNREAGRSPIRRSARPDTGTAKPATSFPRRGFRRRTRLWGSRRRPAGALERIPRHERDHHRAQYRL